MKPRDPEERSVARILLALVVSALGGGILGYTVHAAMGYAVNPGIGVQAAFLNASLTRAMFAGVGALVSLALMSPATGAHRLAHALRFGMGVVFGGLIGLVLYAVGYVASFYLTAPVTPYYVLYFVEAVYSQTLIELLSVVGGAAVGVLLVRYSWRFYGIATYIALIAVVAGYLLYSINITIPQVPPSDRPFTIALFTVEAASLLMVVFYSFYALDVFSRKRWNRGVRDVTFSRYYQPKVAFHVTCFNEPPEMVMETLEHLLTIDYPDDRFVILVLDDSTKEDIRAPIRNFCEQNGCLYIHREDRRGFKAGALNNALRYTPADTELIAVIDADYHVEPEYLRETTGYFINPNLGFVQTPQDYRNMHQSFLTEQYYYADGYFYRAVLPSRNEENTIIFCGTMGLVRRRTLEGVGGWAEDHITEDQELSVRILEAGWESLYVNKTFGRGLIPPTFEACKKQLYRWSFGGIKIVKAHFGRFLFSQMSLRQKFDFLIGNLHWFEGFYVVAIAVALGAIALADIFSIDVMLHHQREVWFIGLVPVFLLVDSITRLHRAMNSSMNVSMRGTLKVLGMWMAIKFNNMFAALKSFAGFRIPFIRTPKAPDRKPSRLEAIGRSLALSRFESTAALVCLGLAAGLVTKEALLVVRGADIVLTRVILVVWLLYYALIFACAFLYSYKAYRTFIPDDELFPASGRARRNRRPPRVPVDAPAIGGEFFRRV